MSLLFSTIFLMFSYFPAIIILPLWRECIFKINLINFLPIVQCRFNKNLIWNNIFLFYDIVQQNNLNSLVSICISSYILIPLGNVETHSCSLPSFCEISINFPKKFGTLILSFAPLITSGIHRHMVCTNLHKV